MKNTHKWGAWLGAGALIFTLAGCADRNKNGQPDSPATSGEINNTMEKAGGAASNAASSASDAISKAVPGVEKAVSNAGEAATITPKVKTALGANAGLKGTNINVDTLGAKDTVALRGSVKTASQKAIAEAIAKKNAPGFKIDNQLTVGK